MAVHLVFLHPGACRLYIRTATQVERYHPGIIGKSLSLAVEHGRAISVEHLARPVVKLEPAVLLRCLIAKYL